VGLLVAAIVAQMLAGVIERLREEDERMGTRVLHVVGSSVMVVVSSVFGSVAATSMT
jgi:hypothetical protein